MSIEYCLRIQGELAKASDGILVQAREPFEYCSLEVFDEEAAFAGISFAYFQFGSPHCDLESLQVCPWIGRTVVRRYLDLSWIRNPSLVMRLVKGVFRDSSSSISILGAVLVAWCI